MRTYYAKMSIDEIRVLKHAKPFRPFDIHTKDGRKLRIPFEHRIALAPSGNRVAGFAEDGSFSLLLSEISGVKLRGRRKTSP